MIEQADTQIKTWIQEALGDTEVSLAAPTGKTTGAGVSCYLMALAQSPPVRVPPSTTLRLELCYLVTTYAETPEDAHCLLDRLLLAAPDPPGWVRDLEPIAAEVWSAFGVAPRPAFVVRVPVQWERTEEVKRVLEPLKVVPAESWKGVLLGPGDQPIVHATLELTDLQLTTQTDLEGRFTFAAVPSQPRKRHLRIRAKGLVFDQAVEQLLDGQESKIYMKSMGGKE